MPSPTKLIDKCCITPFHFFLFEQKKCCFFFASNFFSPNNRFDFFLLLNHYGCSDFPWFSKFQLKILIFNFGSNTHFSFLGQISIILLYSQSQISFPSFFKKNSYSILLIFRKNIILFNVLLLKLHQTIPLKINDLFSWTNNVNSLIQNNFIFFFSKKASYKVSHSNNK